MTLTEKRALLIWVHIVKKVEQRRATCDVNWTEESFVKKFCENPDHTTMITSDEELYNDDTITFLTGDEALNLQLYIDSDINEMEEVDGKFPIHIYSNFELGEVYSFFTPEEAYHTQRQLIANQLATKLSHGEVIDKGIPYMPVYGKEDLVYDLPKGTCDKPEILLNVITGVNIITPTFTIPSRVPMIRPRYYISTPSGTEISTIDMLRCYLKDDTIDYELLRTIEPIFTNHQHNRTIV